MPAPTQCQSSAWPGPHPSAFFALGGIQDSTNDCSQKEKADHVSMIGLYLCRQRPTLPHTFACSTIGPAGLNFRVRDGNGWIPRGKITDKMGSQLSAGSPQLVSCEDGRFADPTSFQRARG